MKPWDPDSLESTVPDATWDAVAEWLSEQPDYATPGDGCCPWCEFVGAAHGFTEGERLRHAVTSWPLLSRSPFVAQLREWAPDGALPMEES